MLRITAICMFLTACASGGDAELDRAPIPAAWTADVQAMAGTEPAGFATVTVMPDGETRANLTLRGGSAGERHPWQIREGHCPVGDSEPDPVGAEVGGASDYPQLEPNEGGNASATASLGVVLERDAEYHLEVLKSPDDRSVIACGDFQETG